MTAQEYLEQAQQLDRQIDSKSLQISMLRDLSTKTTGVMSDDVVSHTRNVHSMEDIIAAIIDMEKELHDEVQQAIKLKKEIAAIISSLDDHNERQVLEYRYLCYLEFSEIARRMESSERYVYNKHASALKRIARKIENLQSDAVVFSCTHPYPSDMIHSTK